MNKEFKKEIQRTLKEEAKSVKDFIEYDSLTEIDECRKSQGWIEALEYVVKQIEFYEKLEK